MSDDDYVLGTQSEEIERLGLQHRVWRRRMLDGWHRAGLRPGQCVVDVGAGPGFAAMDLAEIVGPDGRVVALERSRGFLAALAGRAATLGLTNIEARCTDVAAEPFGEGFADMAWCRWVLSFVADPARTVDYIARALKPGGIAIFHEYADYAAWRTLPPSADQERFRDLVMRSWRDSGGEPDSALALPGQLAQAGLELVSAWPLIDIVSRRDFEWEWPAAFMAVNARRLHALGYATPGEAEAFAGALDALPDGALTITPLVAEMVARRPG